MSIAGTVQRSDCACDRIGCIKLRYIIVEILVMGYRFEATAKSGPHKSVVNNQTQSWASLSIDYL